MKKKSLCFITLVLSLCLLLPSALAERLFEYIKTEIIQDTVYFMNDTHIFAHRGDDVLSILEKDNYPEVHWSNALLTSDGEKLYVIDTDNFSLYRLDGDKLEHVVALEMLRGVWMTSPVIHGNYFYVLMRNQEMPMNYELYRYALDTGTAESVTVENCMFWEIARGAEGQLIGWDNPDRRVVVFDGITGKIIASTESLNTYNVGGLCYDAQTADVCFVMNNEIIRWDGKELTGAGYLQVDHCISIYDAGIDAAGNYRAIDRDGYHYDHPGTPLTILSDENDNYFLQQMVYGYMQAYPDVNVYMRYYSSEELSKHAAEGDLLLYNSQDVAISDVAGTVELDSALLRADVNGMYLKIQQYVKKDGALLAYPIDIWTGNQHAGMIYACVSGKSQHQTEALRMLEYYLRHMNDEQRALRYPSCVADFANKEAATEYTGLMSNPEVQLFKILK